MSKNAITHIKGEMSMLNILRLSVIDIQEIEESLQSQMDNAPQLFANSPLVMDCQGLGKQCNKLNFSELYEVVRNIGFIPVGVRNVPDSCLKHVAGSGWAIMRATRSARGNNGKPKTSQVADQQVYGGVEVITRPVRSGQQVYFPEGDIVVLHQTSSGSEVLAGGSIHVYGALRGRVLAGVNGAENARIFCQSLEADLVSIAGCYQLLDDVDTSLKGQPAMIRLEQGKLIFEALT